jgi:hypothetical protein
VPHAFPPTSVIRWVNDEPAIMFGAGRALLLQLAHPHVAAGVDEHSDFQHNPLKRLQGTLEAVYSMVYGPAELADGVGRRVRWIHDFVASPAYRANDPTNLLWVHATLLDSALGCYERLVRRLSGDEVETYYQQMTVVAERFGCPRSAQPADYAAFRSRCRSPRSGAGSAATSSSRCSRSRSTSLCDRCWRFSVSLPWARCPRPFATASGSPGTTAARRASIASIGWPVPTAASCRGPFGWHPSISTDGCCWPRLGATSPSSRPGRRPAAPRRPPDRMQADSDGVRAIIPAEPA